jgi:hypothetical protein
MFTMVWTKELGDSSNVYEIGTIVSGNGNWELTKITIREIIGESFDTVTISPQFRHLVDDISSEPGVTHTPAAASWPLTSPLIVSKGDDIDKSSRPGRHSPHWDIYRFTLTSQGDGFGRIESYTFGASGRHVPEPSTILLLGAGIATITVVGRRKILK